MGVDFMLSLKIQVVILGDQISLKIFQTKIENEIYKFKYL